MKARFLIGAACALALALGAHGSALAFGGGKSGKVGKASEASNETIKVEKAKGANAYTVAELFSKSASLDKKKVVVRGKVVKVSLGIMGKNWIHLKDGTGDAAMDTNKIVVTTQGSADVGDVVTAKGTLAKDKDFGSGYFYAAIVEDATITR